LILNKRFRIILIISITLISSFNLLKIISIETWIIFLSVYSYSNAFIHIFYFQSAIPFLIGNLPRTSQNVNTLLKSYILTTQANFQSLLNKIIKTTIINKQYSNTRTDNFIYFIQNIIPDALKLTPHQTLIIRRQAIHPGTHSQVYKKRETPHRQRYHLLSRTDLRKCRGSS
jgi:hypothetical protein